MKRVFAFLLAALLLLGALLSCGCDGDGLRAFLSRGSLRFRKLEDGTYEVSKKAGKTLPLKVVIPEKYRGKPVTAIADYGFEECETLTAVVLPETIRSIGEGAFLRCTKLGEINLPDGVVTIGAEAFRFCSGLTSVTFGDSLLEIGTDAFLLCESLSSVTIPATVEKIGEGAFTGCTRLILMISSANRCYTVRDGCLIETATGTLLAAPSPELIPTDGSVRRLGAHLFYSDAKIKSVTLPEGVVALADGVFYSCRNLVSVTLPESLETIGAEAFYHCESLKTVTVGKNLAAVGTGAFNGCRKLSEIRYSGTKAEWFAIRLGGDWNAESGGYIIYCMTAPWANRPRGENSAPRG